MIADIFEMWLRGFFALILLSIVAWMFVIPVLRFAMADKEEQKQYLKDFGIGFLVLVLPTVGVYYLGKLFFHFGVLK